MSRTGKLAPVFIALALITVFASCKMREHKESDILTDQLGRKVRLEEFQGKVVLMNFIYTSCPNKACDLMSLHFLRLQLLLKDRIGKDLIFLSISIDPEKDTPAVIRKYAERFKAEPNGWRFLTADPEYTDRLSKKYGVIWKTDPDGSRHHKVVMALLNRKGEKVAVFDSATTAVEYETEKMEAEIRRLLELKG